MWDETDEFEDNAASKPIIICASVVLIIIVGAIGFIIYQEKVWHDKAIKIAEKKCKEYVKFACNDTSAEMSHIIQGNDAPFGMFPHQAFVEMKTDNRLNKSRKCGGSLISEYFVLSAAHCFHGLEKNYKAKVKLGSITRTEDGTGEWFKIQGVYSHHSFNMKTMQNDLVLLKLDEEVKFKTHLRPICLNTIFKGDYDNVTTSGWGRTENEMEPVRLKMVELNIHSQPILEQLCREVRNYNYEKEICAGQPNKSNSAHRGDSGGPLQIPLKTGCPSTYELIGVTVGTQNSEIELDKPFLSFYSKVAFYVPWIVSHVWENEPDEP